MHIQFNRRLFLTGAAATAVTGAGGLYIHARRNGIFGEDSGDAWAAWHEWPAHKDVRVPETLTRAGALAASPHNSQPWMFGYDGRSILVFADHSRATGAADPYLREMHIALGCCLENMYQAARALGYETDIHILPGMLRAHRHGEKTSPVPAARMTLSPRAPVSSVFYEAIGNRHTNRGPYLADKMIGPGIRKGIDRIGKTSADVRLYIFDEPARQAGFKDAVLRATDELVADPRVLADTYRWVRPDAATADKHRDGLTIEVMGLTPAEQTLARMLPFPGPEEMAARWLERTRDIQLATAPLFGMIAVRNFTDVRQLLETGRIWQRLQLYATANGIAMQPLNQPIERLDMERLAQKPPRNFGRLLQLTGEPDWMPAMTFRMGYPALPATPSPRRPQDDLLYLAEKKQLSALRATP